MKRLEQLYHLAALHSDPKELRAEILRDLKTAPASASSAFAKIAARAT